MSFFNRYETTIIQDPSNQMESMLDKVRELEIAARRLEGHAENLTTVSGVDFSVEVDYVLDVEKRLNWDYSIRPTQEEMEEFQECFNRDIITISDAADYLLSEKDGLREQAAFIIGNLREISDEITTDRALSEVVMLIN